jgi:hypothetical protein
MHEGNATASAKREVAAYCAALGERVATPPTRVASSCFSEATAASCLQVFSVLDRRPEEQ